MDRDIVLVAHDLRSTHNVGSLLRTSEGLGISEVILSGYTPYPAEETDQRLPHLVKKLEKQIDKTALGAQKLIRWRHETDTEDVLKRLKKAGYTLCALEQAKNSKGLDKFFPANNKIAVIVGNEVDGLDQSLLKQADYILEIPMLGKKESFNVVQAAAMALYHLRFHGK